MGTFPKLPQASKSTYWRNVLRGIINRVTVVTKDDGTGLEDAIVTNAALADSSVTEGKIGAAAIAMSKCKFPVTGVNLLPKKYSAFSALEGSSPSADLYVVSGAASSLTKSTVAAFSGTHGITATVSGASNLTFACATGASNYPIPAIGTLLGTYHVFSVFYKRGAVSGSTFVVQLRFSDSSTQVISGTLTPTTSWQRFVSTPFTLNSTSLAYRVEYVITAAASRQVHLADAMLNCTGTDANVTEVGPWIPGAAATADDVDNRTLRVISGYMYPFSGGSPLFDTSKVDSQGRVVTLRQTSADLGVSSILHDSGSGLSKDGSTVNLALASGKTLAVGAKTYIDASGIVKYAAKTRVLWVQQAYSNTAAATEEVATTNSATFQAFAIFAVKKYADDRKIRFVCEAKVSAGTGEIGVIELSFTNGAGSYTIDSSNVTSTTYASRTGYIDVTSGNPAGEELVYATLYAKCSDAKTISVRRCVVEMLTEDV